MKNLFLILLCALMFSCQNDEYRSLPNTIWEKDIRFDFKKNIKDAKLIHKIIVKIKYKDQISLQELPLEILQRFPSGKAKIIRTLIQIQDENGNFFGKKVEELMEVKQDLSEQINFAENGEYTFEISHTSKEKSVPIAGIGFEIYEIKKM
ncbi:MAG: hypothetical protein EAZ97_13185 [Bacteroidetes bacterium]|nr:MAG: hypothetical protein EAZ97_13185 [Bacteroidota bacterium]